MTLLNSTYFTCPRHAIVSVLLRTPKSQVKFFGVLQVGKVSGRLALHF